MPHEPEPGTVTRTPPTLGIGDDGIVQPGHLQMLKDVRLLVHRVLRYYTERSEVPLDSAGLVKAIEMDRENRLVVQSFLYYFVGNGNRKRLYRLSRDRIHTCIEPERS